MSQVRNEATGTVPYHCSVLTASLAIPIGDDRYDRASQPDGQSDFIDGSGPIFSMYLEMAEEEDKKMTESWKADAEGILVFVRLRLLVPYFQLTHRSDWFILRRCRLFAFGVAPGSSTEPAGHVQLLPCQHIPASCRPESIQRFHFPPYFPTSVFSTELCSLGKRPLFSLVISISCAVLATLLQQWARRYVKVTQTRYSLHKRARIRSFFAEGVEKSLLPWAVEALPTLLHVSLVLFFAGLAVFLWNVNLTIFKMVLSWIGVCAALYGSTMLISIFRCDSPYHTPLTPLALPVLFVIAQVTLVALTCYGGLQFIWTVCFSSCGPRIPYKADDRFGRFVRTKISRFIAPSKSQTTSRRACFD